MSQPNLSTVRELLNSYCGLCDAVLERAELRFGSAPALSMFLVARTSNGVPCRITLRLLNVKAYRFEFLDNQAGGVISEGVRVEHNGDNLLVDFGDDPDLLPGAFDWQAASKKWCVCEALDLTDEKAYEPGTIT